MKRSQRFQTIVDLKARQEQSALEAVGECQKRNQEAKQQLQSLIDYRQEYLDKYQVWSNNGMPIKSLLEYRAFMEKLNQAIHAQTHIMEQLELELAQKRKDWELQHQNTKNMQKVFDGFVSEENKLANKREQSEADDRASRMQRGPNNGT